MKILHVVLKVLFSLILLMPVLGATGVFPPPTPDLYNTPEAFAYIESLMGTYLSYANAFTCALAFVLLWSRRVALAMIIALPVTVNVVAFHLFMDGGLFTSGALLGNIMLLINVYFIWQERAVFAPLLEKKA